MIDFESHKNKLERALCVKNPSTNKNCVDKIEEKLWVDNVMPALNDISLKAAEELQEETGSRYAKDTVSKESAKDITGTISIEELRKQKDSNIIIGSLEKWTGFQLNPFDLAFTDSTGNILGVRRLLKYSDVPPTRLLSMTLILSYWLGWLDAKGRHALDSEPVAAWRRIKEAYDKGKADALKP
jgi:hypothetical protein